MSLARCATARRTSSLTRTTASPVTGSRPGEGIGRLESGTLARGRAGAKEREFAILYDLTFLFAVAFFFRPTSSASNALGQTSATLQSAQRGFLAKQQRRPWKMR